MRYHVRPTASPLIGSVRVPGDKSISHRAVLFSAMADGTSRITGVLDSADVRSTIAAVSALGAVVEIIAEETDGLTLLVHGWGSDGPVEPVGPIDCGNSGTTIRLLLGVLAGWGIHAVLTGDESLSRRPMRRVTAPLAEMGARFETAEGGVAPVGISGSALAPADFDLPVASAQVKTALLLAALRAPGTTTVCEPAPSRDHTERMLPGFGVPVTRDGLCASVTGPTSLTAADVAVPADPSSAAFLVGAALLVRGSDVTLPGISLNTTRIGFLRVLARMGADIDVTQGPDVCGEPTGDVRVRFTERLDGTTITAEEVPSLIDEVPLLAIVATAAVGTTRFEGVGELRVKESDRLAAIADAINALQGGAVATEDTLTVTGGRPLVGAELDSLADHRLAMAFAIAGLVAEGETVIDRFEAVDVSYPGFAGDVKTLMEGTSH
ncbi:MAG: 3-phosphoshikimate 1-carboxyvinyltransferase [Actinobacteria bacterium HGW-Actinobacteria-1]|jgi:3-phosphoshikimate 1-carboxyvinyltransferase|nr:MAG: 3-phosphoshikimate 1-carboxyvinyltransferase [Actinobacteria bacterium HGW-Actinobacteria-1]